MKKILCSVILFLLSVGFSGAGQDMFGNQRPALWRSSRTATADNFVLIATGAIHFHGIVVGTTSVNTSPGFVSIFNSTTTNTALYSFSTAAFLNTTVLVPNTYWDITLSSGLVYNKQGIADVDILWDYLVPRIEKLVPFNP